MLRLYLTQSIYEYATGARSIQIYTSQSQASPYVAHEEPPDPRGPTGSPHLAIRLETTDEIIVAKTASHTVAGPKVEARELEWVLEMGAMITKLYEELRL